MATGYWSSMTLLSLNELGVFDAMGADGASSSDLHQTLECDERALTLLLNAGVSLGLVSKEGVGADAVFSPTDLSRAFLVQGGPAYLGGAFRYALDVFAAWGQLPAAVRTGEPQLAEETYLGGDSDRTERFVRGMHGRAMGTATSIAEGLDLSGRTKLLDVAGGSGAFSILLCGRTPGLTATVCDLPGVLAVSERIIAEAGLTDRVCTAAWDLRTNSGLPTGHDTALVSGVIHRLDPDTARALLRQVFEALAPGATIALADVMLDDTGTGPPTSALFALNMLVTAPGGGAHRAIDHVTWLEAEGFVDTEVRLLPPPAMHTLVLARRP
jgi:hypothetical protein